MPIKGISNWNKKLDRLEAFLKQQAPHHIAAGAERFYRSSFIKRGFTDQGFRPWHPLATQKQTKGGRLTVKKGRILNRTGALANSVRADARGGVVRVMAGGRDVPYAAIHNTGGHINRQVTVRQHTRRRPGVREHHVKRHQRMMNTYIRKRQFIGYSRTLELQLRKDILARTYKIMKP